LNEEINYFVKFGGQLSDKLQYSSDTKTIKSIPGTEDSLPIGKFVIEVESLNTCTGVTLRKKLNFEVKNQL
jgi:hypothetical protein